MKKILVLLLSIIIVSCTEKEQFVTLVESDVTLFFDGSKQLTVTYSSDEMKSKSYLYTSTDTTVVRVSSTGFVNGVSLGTAKVKIATPDGKYSDECNFKVNPKSILYKEPNKSFGSSISIIKSTESRTLIKEDATSLIYTDADSDVRYLIYLFENNQLEYSLVLLTENTLVATEVVTFLMERYEYSGESQQVYFFTDRKSKVNLGLSVDDELGLCVIYMPPTLQKTPVFLDASVKMPVKLFKSDLKKSTPQLKQDLEDNIHSRLNSGNFSNNQRNPVEVE